MGQGVGATAGRWRWQCPVWVPEQRSILEPPKRERFSVWCRTVWSAALGVLCLLVHTFCECFLSTGSEIPRETSSQQFLVFSRPETGAGQRSTGRVCCNSLLTPAPSVCVCASAPCRAESTFPARVRKPTALYLRHIKLIKSHWTRQDVLLLLKPPQSEDPLFFFH